MENLELYSSFASVPNEAKKTITGGRLKGMTDINPMWRIKKLTERFGACGFGWKYKITNKELSIGDDGVICAFVDIDLFVKVDGEWSEPIPGTGGSSFVAKEQKGKYTNDECFKMALTDALSVACKALGMGADVYWAEGRTKYTANEEKPKQPPREQLISKLKEKGIDINAYAEEKGLSGAVPDSRFEELLKELEE